MKAAPDQGELKLYEPPRIILYGLGPIGTRIGALFHHRKAATIVGAIDIDPEKVGRDVGEFFENPEILGVRISSEAEKVLMLDAQAVILATGSSLNDIFAQVSMVLNAGKRLLTTCEELVHPRANLETLTRRVDEAAKKNRVAVLGIGVNPGFAMDFLPCVLTGLCENVRRIFVKRRQDARIRREPFQRKIGAGLTLDAFEQKKRTNQIGHVGLRDSLEAISRRIGWQIDEILEEMKPIVAESEIRSESIHVQAGQVAGMSQRAAGIRRGEEAIVLEMEMALGLADPEDSIRVEGQQDFHFRVPGGIEGDSATAALVVNALPVLSQASPGLHTGLDLPPVTFFDALSDSQGSRKN